MIGTASESHWPFAGGGPQKGVCFGFRSTSRSAWGAACRANSQRSQMRLALDDLWTIGNTHSMLKLKVGQTPSDIFSCNWQVLYLNQNISWHGISSLFGPNMCKSNISERSYDEPFIWWTLLQRCLDLCGGNGKPQSWQICRTAIMGLFPRLRMNSL